MVRCSGKGYTKRLIGVMVCTLVAVVVSPAMAQVTYSIDQIEDLLDADYYAGVAKNGVEGCSERGAYAPASNWDGTQVAFFGLNFDTFDLDIYIVDIGDTSSWRRVAPEGVTGTMQGVAPPITFTVSGNYIWVDGQRLVKATGEGAGSLYDAGNGIHLYSPHGAIVPGGKIMGGGIVTGTQLQGFGFPLSDNLRTWNDLTEDSDVVEGSLDGWTTFFADTENVRMLAAMWSPDGDKIAFLISEKESNTLGVPDEMSIYVLNDVQAILASGLGVADQFNTAPTSLADPRFTLIRGVAGADNLDAFEGSAKGLPVISADNSVIVWSEDFNDYFANFDQATTLESSDLDVMLGNLDNTTADNANSDNDVRYADATSNFAITGATPGGLRIFAYSDAGQPSALQSHAYIATFVAENEVTATVPQTDGTVLVDSDGNNVVVADEATTDTVQVTAETVIQDPVGTEIILPPNQVIIFPQGESTISVVTPTAPVEEAEIPPLEELTLPAGVEPEDVANLAIPIERTFGPSGTLFSPAVEVKISYTDAEVAGIADEGALLPFLFNEATSKFDIILDPADIVERNVDENYIIFTVDHFSTYALGAPAAMGLPQSEESYNLLVVLLALAGSLYATVLYRRQRKA